MNASRYQKLSSLVSLLRAALCRWTSGAPSIKLGHKLRNEPIVSFVQCTQPKANDFAPVQQMAGHAQADADKLDLFVIGFRDRERAFCRRMIEARHDSTLRLLIRTLCMIASKLEAKIVLPLKAGTSRQKTGR